jgi:hypothetical protein
MRQVGRYLPEYRAVREKVEEAMTTRAIARLLGATTDCRLQARELLISTQEEASGGATMYRISRTSAARDRPLQTWKTFLRNHMEGIASIDLFVVPTVAFQQLYAFLVLGHRWRRLLWFCGDPKPNGVLMNETPPFRGIRARTDSVCVRD